MTRPIPSAIPAGPRYTIAVTGDSLSESQTWTVPQHLQWSCLLEASLRALGGRVRHRNFARNGNTTTDMLTRLSTYSYYDVPKMMIVFGGVNDPGNAISGATTTANIEAIITPLFALGTPYALVVSPHFLNYTSGGDATGQTKPGGTYAGVYDAQVAAVAALSATYPGRVVFVDLWDWMRDLIVAGTDTLASASWHVAGTNQHLNAYGHRIVRDAILAAIVAQSGWLTALEKG